MNANEDAMITLASLQEIGAVQQLWSEYWDSLGFPADFQGFAEERKSLPGAYAPPKGRLVLALVQDQLAGTGALRPLNERSCEAKRLYVRPPYRGHGVGRALLTKLVQEARGEGYEEMYADTLASMGPALRLYAQLGFSEVGPYSSNPTPGAIYLKCSLFDPTEPNWKRAALLTIDMQNDFALPAGAGFVPGTDAILPAFARLLDVFRATRLPIFHAARLYLEDGSNAERCRQKILQEGLSLARPGTPGARVVDAIRSPSEPDLSSRLFDGEYVSLGPSEWLFYKSRWSAFYETGLEERLQTLEIDTIVVAGCNFPNCPSATLFDLTERRLRAVLAADAVSGLTESGVKWCAGIGVNPLTVDQIEACFKA